MNAPNMENELNTPDNEEVSMLLQASDENNTMENEHNPRGLSSMATILNHELPTTDASIAAEDTVIIVDEINMTDIINEQANADPTMESVPHQNLDNLSSV